MQCIFLVVMKEGSFRVVYIYDITCVNSYYLL